MSDFNYVFHAIDITLINNRKIPILSLYQTSYYQGRGEVAAGYEDDLVIGKQVARCLSEMKRLDMV